MSGIFGDTGSGGNLAEDMKCAECGCSLHSTHFQFFRKDRSLDVRCSSRVRCVGRQNGLCGAGEERLAEWSTYFAPCRRKRGHSGECEFVDPVELLEEYGG